MWPLMVQILNWPPKFRKSFAEIQLLGIVPGHGTAEPKNLEPYLEVFVDEMKELSNCSMYVNAEWREVKVKLLQYVFDFPAIAKVMHTQAQGGLSACPWCQNKGKHCKTCSKTLYLGSRKFLKTDSPLRKSSLFPGDKDEMAEPPKAYTKEKQLELRHQYEQNKNKSQKDKFTKENRVKGEYAFMKLPYHGFTDDYQSDGMYTVKCVVSTTFV
eukprot:TCONS_00025353-protein